MIFNVNSGAGKQPVNVVPSTNSSFTYDGSAKTPLWQNFNPEQLTISGADSATNAGTYKVYFTPKADYEWWDGTSTPKEVQWSISKAAGSLSLSATSATVTGKNSGAKTFTVTRAGDGKISVTSSNTAYATASVSGTTVTVTPKGYGTATITVSVAAGTNHTAPSSKTYTITINVLYLYNAGNENTSVTGGWTARAWAGNEGHYAAQPSLTKNGTYMKATLNHYTATQDGTGVIEVVKDINLSNYSTLYIEYTASSTDSYWRLLEVINRNSTYWYVTGLAWAHLNDTNTVTKASLNISTISGSYDIIVGLNGAEGTNTTNIYKIWLE